MNNTTMYTCGSCGFTAAALPKANVATNNNDCRPHGLPSEWLWQSQDGKTWDGENLLCPDCAAELMLLLLGRPH
jgi:hypothetical protein